MSSILSVWSSAQAFSQVAVKVHSSLVRPMNAKLPSSRVTSSNVRGQPGVAALIDTPSMRVALLVDDEPGDPSLLLAEGHARRQSGHQGRADEYPNDADGTKPHGKLLGMSRNQSAVYRTRRFPGPERYREPPAASSSSMAAVASAPAGVSGGTERYASRARSGSSFSRYAWPICRLRLVSGGARSSTAS